MVTCADGRRDRGCLRMFFVAGIILVGINVGGYGGVTQISAGSPNAKNAETVADAADAEFDEFDDLDKWEVKEEVKKEVEVEKAKAPTADAPRPKGSERIRQPESKDQSGDPKQPPQKLPNAGGHRAAEGTNQPSPPRGNQITWLEWSFSITLIAFAINYYIGRHRNLAVAQKLHDACGLLMTEMFAHVGTHDAETLIQESAHEFALFGSGRRYFRRMTVALELPKRHDLVNVFSDFLHPTKPDMLEINIEMDPDSCQAFIFALSQTWKKEKFKGNRKDLCFMAKTYNGDNWRLPKTLSVLTDSKEVAGMIMSGNKGEMVKFFERFADQIQSLHFSDQHMGLSEPLSPYAEASLAASGEKKELGTPQQMLTIQFEMNVEETSADDLQYIVKTAIRFVEMAVAIRLSSQTTKDNAKLRSKLTESLTREDPKELAAAANERRFEQKLKERERYEAMPESSPARVKWERKQEKEKAKADAKKGKRVMKMR